MKTKHKKHIIIQCEECNIEFVLINYDNERTSELLNNMICPYKKCKSKKLIVRDATDSFKECMNDKNIYKRRRGRIIQIE